MVLYSSMDARPGLVGEFISICFPDAKTVLDITWGKGKLWTDKDHEHWKIWGSDLDPSRGKDFVADFTCLPILEMAVDIVVYDPPFLGDSAHGLMGRRFGVLESERTTQIGAGEALFAARLGVVAKCQDHIHGSRPVWMSQWLIDVLGAPYDFMAVRQPSKLIGHNWDKANQLSVWRNHSTYFAWRKDGNQHRRHH